MSRFSQTAFKRAYGLTRQWQTLSSSSEISSSPKSLLACQSSTTRATSSATSKRLVDDDIPFRAVRLADPESGSLRPLTPLRTLLSSIDRTTHHIELVADAPDPVVKIVNTKQARERYKEAKKRAQAAARAQVRKEIQLTWGVAAGDLAHKLEKARQELVGGRKVDLIFASKKGQAVPTKQAMDTRLKDALDTLADVGKEYRARGEQKNIVALYLKPLGES